MEGEQTDSTLYTTFAIARLSPPSEEVRPPSSIDTQNLPRTSTTVILSAGSYCKWCQLVRIPQLAPKQALTKPPLEEGWKYLSRAV